ncbi:MAG: hypothetical protein PWP37_982 [Thermotogota bacterium]|nr:hypothetical protein [Thermotogota bacterium]MDK2864790.1 hypothetical protein [Thermotogota bacterium]
MRVNDIIEMAVRVENDGELFYTEAARVAEDPKVRKTFEQLAAQEKAHAASFRKLLEDQDEEWDEIDAYLSTYASANIIPDLNLIVPELKRMTVSEVIDLAIGIEKDSIILYYELLDTLADERAKSVVRNIISQEKEHVSTLHNLRKGL